MDRLTVGAIGHTAAMAQLTRQEISDAVSDLGWRSVLLQLVAFVRVGSVVEAADVARRIVGGVGTDAGEHVHVDVRADRAVVSVQTFATGRTTRRDIDIARRITEIASEVGLRTEPVAGPARSVQVLEIAVDAMDIPLVRPFWKAAFGYVDEGADAGPEDPLVDPLGQQPAIWFQQMDAPRAQRNRIHFDVSVPHDEARQRIQTALGAGGTLLSDAEAPAFWVLADPEGNEVCITTWQGRD
jgi:4a-hydroxytetrahydrobiopterin dehydratase